MRWYQPPYTRPAFHTGGAYDKLDTQQKRSAIIFVGLQKGLSYRCNPKKKENHVFDELAKMGLLDVATHKTMKTYSYNPATIAMIAVSPNDWGGEWIASRYNVLAVKEKLASISFELPNQTVGA